MSESPSLTRLQAALAERYRIEREIGHGGMATVYLAHDLKHERAVAVKVLRPDLAATLGSDRFLREVRIAASLTHPHILGLHDSGEAGGFLYYVMPYIEGESLRDRLTRERDLPVPEAVRIIQEIVDALAYAHAHNIVHRDIKPDNVLLSRRHAMVTDFGVAKAVSEATGRDKLTTAGVALGTPAYMSPEQASAEPHIDHRADIYAVGVVAYELLAGDPPFTGTTQQQILAAHITETPRPLGERRVNLPPALEQLVMKCLNKRPSDRWQTADEMLPVLEALGTPSGGITPPGTVPLKGVAHPTRATRIAVLTGVVVALAILGFLGWSSLRPGAPRVTVSNIRQVTRGAEVEINPAISPSGGEVAYAVWSGQTVHVYVRDLEGGRPILLSADERAGADLPRWTPDGRSIVFTAGGRGSVVPRFGGPGRWVGTGLIWDVRADRVASVRNDSILLGDLGGGPLRVITTVSAPYSLALSPDGRRLAYVTGNPEYARVGSPGIAPSAIWVVDVEGGKPVATTDNRSLNTSPIWLPDGRHLLFISNRDGPKDVYLVRVGASGRARGSPMRVTTGLEPHSISISANATKAVYSRLLYRRNIYAVRIPSTGSASTREGRAVTAGNQIVENHGLSPDGRWLAFDANLEGNQDIFVIPVGGGEPRRLTTEPADDFHPDFSPDGREIAFHSPRQGTRDVYVMNADGGNVRRVTQQAGDEYHPSFSPDGRHITYGYREIGGNWVYIVSRESPGADWGRPRRLSSGANTRWLSRWSPDGQRVAMSLRDRLFTISLDGVERTVVEGHATGLGAIVVADYSRDGRLLYFTGIDTAGRGALYEVPAKGGRPRQVIRFDDPTRPVWPLVTIGDGVVYLSIADYESDVYAMDLKVR